MHAFGPNSATDHRGASTTVDDADGGFHHEALFYAGEQGFIQGALPFLRDAVAAEQPVLVAVSRAKLELLEEAFGHGGEYVHYADMSVLAANPARMIAAWCQFLKENAPAGRPARAIGEMVWPGRSRAELAECERYESLLQLAFADDRPWHLLCPYDLDGLDARVICAAERSHPYIAQGQRTRRSGVFARSEEAANPYDGTLPPPPSQAEELHFTLAQLASVRSFADRRAAETRLSGERAEELVLAVNELATNSVRHGGGRGTLRIWRDAETLLCEVRDRGRLDEPLAGRIRPEPDQLAGHGLWLVNQLCDLVQIRSGADGTVVRVHVRVP